MDWEALIGRFIHPTQVAVIEAMPWVGRPMSPVQLVRSLNGEMQLSSVAYHVRRLTEIGVLKPTGTRQVRGTVEHFFRLAATE